MPLSDSMHGINTSALTFLHTNQGDITDYVIAIFVYKNIRMNLQIFVIVVWQVLLMVGRSLNCSAETPDTFVKHRSD